MPNDEELAVELLGRTDHGRLAASLRAMPFLALARHVVVDGRVLLRLHRGCGYHRACLGSVVAYGTDNLTSAGPGESVWSVQIVGRCEAVEPTPSHRALFGPAPRFMDGEPFDPVHLSIEPQFSTVHSADDAMERQFRRTL
ncbi:pyridoxamine 5'-phosphate oxidase family protein [Streptomyces mirabilis]